MGIDYWALLITVFLYGGLTIFAGTVQLKNKKINTLSSIAMIIGGFLIILTSINENNFGYFTFYFLILGLLLIHFSAINNGIKLYKKITIRHHLIRLLVSLLIIIIFLLR
ncbi:MAG: hypothetical protein Q8934_21770 [Bacillota bacterium]|nr:hypothetical protein [Bacillota bacterium]